MKRRTKGRTWADAAKMVLEKHPRTPMSHKEILRVIQEENLKDLSRSGTTPLLCLNSCLHANSRGLDSMFYKVAGKSGVYGLMCDLPEGSVLCEMDDDSDSMTELVDDNGRPVQPGSQGSSRSFSDKRKDKVMYVKLPKGVPILSAAEDTSPLGLVNGHSETSSTVTDISETLSEAPSTDTPASSTPSLVDIMKEDSGLTPDHSDHHLSAKATASHSGACSTSSTLLTAANRLAVAKRKNRNNPLRHYTKRRKKKKNKFSRIKVRTSTSSLKSLSHKSVSSPVSGLDSSGTPSPTVNPITGIAQPKRQTLREMLAALPGFNFKPRNRKNRMSMAAQIQQIKEGSVDLENPTSILVNTNLKALLNMHTFSMLPPAYQYQLIKLLPECDQVNGPESSLRMNSTALNNEFFSKACTEWRDRLADGEFTQESQMRIKQEEEKQRQKLDPWKVKHFEPVWGKRLVQSPVSLPKSPSFGPAMFTSTAATAAAKTSDSRHAELVNLRSKLASTRTSRLVGIVDKLVQQRSGEDSSKNSVMDSLVKTEKESSLNFAKGSIPVEEEVVVEDAVNEVVTTPMELSHSGNEVLLQQLKRPPDIKTEPVIPPKKSRPSPPVDHVLNRTVIRSSNNSNSSKPAVSSGQALVGHQERLASPQKVRSPPSSIHLQGISVTASHPSLSSSLGAVTQVVTVQNQVVSASRPHDRIHVQSASPGRVHQTPLSTNTETSTIELPTTMVNYSGPVISSTAAKTLAHIKALQAAKAQSQANQSSQPKTKTLADIKAHLKAKTHPRHLPNILQGKPASATSASSGRQSVESTTSQSSEELPGKVDLVRSNAIVQRAIEQSRQNQHGRLPTANTMVVQKPAKSADQVRTVMPVIAANQLVPKQVVKPRQEVESQGSGGGLLMVQNAQQPRRSQVVQQSVQHSVPQASSDTVKMVQVTKPTATSQKTNSSLTVAERLRLKREQGQNVSNNLSTGTSVQQQQAIISNVSHQISVQTQPVPVPHIAHPVQAQIQRPAAPAATAGAAAATSNTTIILPPQQSLAATNDTKIYVVDQKNSVAAGGQNQSTLSSAQSAHQPERKANDQFSPTNFTTAQVTKRSVTPISSVNMVPVCKQIVYVSQSVNTAVPKAPSPAPVQAASARPSTGVGTLPKIKFIRVTSADGEIRYVLSSNSNNNSSSGQQNVAKDNQVHSARKLSSERDTSSSPADSAPQDTKVNATAYNQLTTSQPSSSAQSSGSLGKNSSLSSSHPSLQRLLSEEREPSVSSTAAAIVSQVLAANPPPSIKLSTGRSMQTTSMSQATTGLQKTNLNISSSSALLQALRGSNGIHSKKQGSVTSTVAGGGLDTSVQSPPKPQRVLSPTQMGGIKVGLQDKTDLGIKSSQKSNCVCNMRAMVMCKKCGTYCHDDCIGPSKLCVSCIIAT